MINFKHFEIEIDYHISNHFFSKQVEAFAFFKIHHFQWLLQK